MSPPGRPKGESLSAQREGSPVSTRGALGAWRRVGETRAAVDRQAAAR